MSAEKWNFFFFYYLLNLIPQTISGGGIVRELVLRFNWIIDIYISEWKEIRNNRETIRLRVPRRNKRSGRVNRPYARQ